MPQHRQVPPPCYDHLMQHGAEILVIGNEILSGKVLDANAPYLISELRQLGVPLVRITTIPDDRALVAAEVARAASHCEHVFTTGGIGPTLDDITIPAVADAFGLGIDRNDALAALITARAHPPITDAHLRMADLPVGATLILGENATWPVIAVRNVYIFPGTPSLVRRKFAMIRERFRQSPWILKRVDLNADEAHYSAALDEVAAAYPTLSLGSYPHDAPTDHLAYVTFESKVARDVDDGVALFLSRVSANCVVRVT